MRIATLPPSFGLIATVDTQGLLGNDIALLNVDPILGDDARHVGTSRQRDGGADS